MQRGDHDGAPDVVYASWGRRAVAVCIDLALVGSVIGLYLFAWAISLLLSVLWPLWGPRNQTLVDKMVATVVLRR